MPVLVRKQMRVCAVAITRSKMLEESRRRGHRYYQIYYRGQIELALQKWRPGRQPWR